MENLKSVVQKFNTYFFLLLVVVGGGGSGPKQLITDLLGKHIKMVGSLPVNLMLFGKAVEKAACGSISGYVNI